MYPLTEPLIQWVPRAPSLQVKRPGREADHSPPFSAEVNECVGYTFTSQFVFMVWCFTLTVHEMPNVFTDVCQRISEGKASPVDKMKIFFHRY